MLLYTKKDLKAAYGYARAGGQALHLSGKALNNSKISKIFRGKEFAHLLDNNLHRLLDTAARLGVKILKIECKGTKKQHIDLVGEPLERAKR